VSNLNVFYSRMKNIYDAYWDDLHFDCYSATQSSIALDQVHVRTSSTTIGLGQSS